MAPKVKNFLSSHNIPPASIIFEITEKTAIQDYTCFKQALIKSLVTFAKSTNIKLIAEGIECEEELAMAREDSKTYDCVVVEKDSKYYGLVTIKRLLEFSTILERSYAISLNPLTKLPGNNVIEEVLDDLTTSDLPHCILYFDLDNFKAYNDTYGFEKGDNVLKFTAELLQTYLKRYFSYNSFLGHIGGDDFICTINGPLNECMEFCDELLSEFDKHIPFFYSSEDRANGFIKSKDRNGNPSVFSITSISIAGLYGNLNTFSGGENIAELTSLIKKESKSINGSSKFIKELN